MGKRNNDLSEQGKLPPQAVDFEEALLGTCIEFPDILIVVTSILIKGCFYKDQHNIIYNALIELNESDTPIDIVTVAHHIKKDKKAYELIDNSYYINVIATKSNAGIDVKYYCYVIMEMFIKRELITLLTNNLDKLYSLESDYNEICTIIIEHIEEITEYLSNEQRTVITNSVERAIKELKTIASNPDDYYIITGNKLVDDFVFLCDGMILCIASSAGVGKTSFLISLMKGIYDNNDDIASIWFTFEDPDVKILRSFTSIDTKISSSKMMGKGDKLTDSELNKVVDCMNNYSSYNLEFVNESQYISKIKNRCKVFAKKNKDKTIIIAIDNVMLIKDMQDAGNNTTPVEDKIAQIFRDIINTIRSKGNKVILIFLHHMTKEMEAKVNLEEGYRPKLSHIKGSTRFVDVSNAIILLNKPGKHKDLIKIQSQLPDIKCKNSDGSFRMVNRKALLQNMLIAEIAKNRDFEMSDDNKAIERYIVNHKILEYKPLIRLK